MSDFAAKLDEARQKLPLKQLMEQYGRGPKNGNWKSFPHCPYCEHKSCAGVFTGDRGVDLFKCRHSDCKSGTQDAGKAWDQVGFLQYELHISDRKEACIALMKMANVWTDHESHPPSVMPGKAARRKPVPSGGEENAQLMTEAVAWLRQQGMSQGSTESRPTNQTISVRGLMKGLGLGYSRAASVINELERRQLISTAGENGVRTILPAPESPALSSAGTPPLPDTTSSSVPATVLAVPGPGTDDPGQPPLATDPAAVPASGDSLSKVLDDDIEKWITYIKLTEKLSFAFIELENSVGFARAKEMIPVLLERKLVRETAAGVFQRIQPPVLLATPGNVIPLHGGGGGKDGGSGNGGGAPPPTDPSGDEPTVPPALEALRWFYERLTLNDKDRAELFEKRGLHDATIDLFGYRSNPQSNKDLLLEMEQHFPLAVLLDCGLWKMDESKVSEPPKPNAQYYGMSIVEKRDAAGKKIRNEDGEALKDFLWNNPVLIPYFNARGELVHLRPHKGMMKDRAPHFYVARPAKQYLDQFKAVGGQPQFAAISEGEFKSAAQWQVIGDMAACGSLPGITMAKTLMFADIEEWIESTGVKQAVIGYDNEDKGNPELPGYQEDDWKRHDAQAWARYLARQLSKQGYDGKVCVLPDEWRDPNTGKADWDGQLAVMEKRLALALGITPEPTLEFWHRVEAKIRQEFLAVIKKALPVAELWQAGFFDRKEERIIKNKLEKISYEPCLPVGGDDETALAKKLQRLAMKLRKSDWFPLKLCGFMFMLAGAYTSVSGRYFKMKALTEKQALDWTAQLVNAKSRGDDEAKRAIEMVLRGKKSMNRLGHIPEAVSDFYLKPQYVLHRINGQRTRMVSLHNVHGVNTGLLTLPSRQYTTPVEFRTWLADSATGGAWDGGQNELTALHEDMGHEMAFKDVMEVPVRGYHEKSKMWFFEDVCFSDGGEFKPDPKTGIFWVKSSSPSAGGKKQSEFVQGYSFARDSSGRPRDREDEVFRQGVPKMHPEKNDTDADALDFFKEVAAKMKDTLGGFEAYMALGMVLASAAGPEIYKEWSAFPGLWVHGAQGEGKSSVVRWLIRMWGFNKEKGLPLPSDERGTLTAAALAGSLGQYGEIHLWLDEYQPTAPSWVRAILKNSYDRAEGGKKDFGASPREFLSGVIVSGIATSTEPQTKSRFAHIQVSSKNRKANHYAWFQTNSQQFYRIGKFLMRHRKQYVESALVALRNWIASPAMREVDDRARMVHGLAYAGFHAACEVFNMEFAAQDYKLWLVEHCKTSAAEVQESVSLDLFWREMLTANEADAFGETPADRRRFFNVQEEVAANSPVSDLQTKHGAEHGYTKWKSFKLYFQAGPVLEMLRQFKRKSGGNFPSQTSDLLNQMKVEPYYVPPLDKKQHKQKFNGVNKSCWCIRVDFHELGLVRHADDEFMASLLAPPEQQTLPGQEIHVGREKWMDPRKGDLFGLIESLESKSSDGDTKQT